MTTEEFVEAVNAIDNRDEIKAYVSARGDVFLRTPYGDEDVAIEIAILEKHDTSWGVRTISQVTFPTKILKLMVEIAKTPPEEREEQPKYVILNGMPRYGTCYYFVTGRYDQLIASHDDGVNIEKYAAFSQEELVERKKHLTPELAAAVDMMTVTLERAIELTEKSRHDDLD